MVAVPGTRLLAWVGGFADRHGPYEVTTTPDHLVLDARDGARATIEVPFPPLEGRGITALVAHVARPRRVGVLLVRRAGHAVGVFDGTTLLASKVDSTYVQGTTRAGGWSQQRYARRRSNQAAAAFGEAADVAARILLAPGPPLDALVCGGDRPAVTAVLDDRRLQPLQGLVTGPWLQVKDPKLKILQATPEQFLALRVTVQDPPAG